MTILLLDQFSDLGGAQQTLLGLVPALRERGWKIRAAVPPGGPLVERLEAEGVAVDRLRFGPYHSGRKTAGDAWRMISDSRRVASEVDWSAGLVYVNGPRLLPAAALAKAGPLVFHAHSHLAKGYAVLLARWALKRAKGVVIATCESVARPFRGHAPTRVVYNGVRDHRSPPDRAPGPPRIGMLGRISPEKGQLDLVRAARLLPEMEFHVFGGALFSEARYERRVRREAPPNVIFRGWRDGAGDAYRHFDVAVTPSRGPEAVPLVILEAYSAGKPVVAARVGGIPEIVEDGRTGILVDPASPEAIASGIRRALLEADMLAANGRDAWRRRFQLHRFQDDVLAVLDEIVRNRTAAARIPAAATGNVAG